jgi:hypothetical protein
MFSKFSMIQQEIRRHAHDQRYFALLSILSLGAFTAVAALAVIVLDLLSLVCSALQSVIIAVAHSHPLVQVTLLLLTAYAIKRNWRVLKRWFWQLIR